MGTNELISTLSNRRFLTRLLGLVAAVLLIINVREIIAVLKLGNKRDDGKLSKNANGASVQEGQVTIQGNGINSKGMRVNIALIILFSFT